MRASGFSNSVCSLSRHDPASLRGLPGDLGLHAEHRGDLQHHSVSVPRPRVRDQKPHVRRVVPHPHHGHLQHVRLRGQGERNLLWSKERSKKCLLSYAQSYSLEMAMKFFWPDLLQQCNIYFSLWNVGFSLEVFPCTMWGSKDRGCRFLILIFWTNCAVCICCKVSLL